MITKVTNDIAISVETQYQPEHSNPLSNKYLFAYRITIENNSDFTIQVLSRHWYIFDSIGKYEEVIGEGVVGEQPIIPPGESHQYISCCPLRSALGRMHGSYTCQRMDNDESFDVDVPKFIMVATERLN